MNNILFFIIQMSLRFLFFFAVVQLLYVKVLLPFIDFWLIIYILDM
jgi:hypothetical protein